MKKFILLFFAITISSISFANNVLLLSTKGPPGATGARPERPKGLPERPMGLTLIVLNQRASRSDQSATKVPPPPGLACMARLAWLGWLRLGWPGRLAWSPGLARLAEARALLWACGSAILIL